MFGLFRKDPARELQKEYERLLQKARDQQRGGDVRASAATHALAEEVARRMEAIREAGK